MHVTGAMTVAGGWDVNVLTYVLLLLLHTLRLAAGPTK